MERTYVYLITISRCLFSMLFLRFFLLLFLLFISLFSLFSLSHFLIFSHSLFVLLRFFLFFNVFIFQPFFLLSLSFFVQIKEMKCRQSASSTTRELLITTVLRRLTSNFITCLTFPRDSWSRVCIMARVIHYAICTYFTRVKRELREIRKRFLNFDYLDIFCSLSKDISLVILREREKRE